MDTDRNHNQSVSPADRPLEPEHPMMLNGDVIPGDMDLMARCMLEELLLLGAPIDQLRAMSHNPEYQALFAMRRALGQQLDEIMDDALDRIGRRRFATRESTNDVRPATLTIGASGRSA